MLGGDVIAVSADIVGVRTRWVWLTAVRVENSTPSTWPLDDPAGHPFCLTTQIPLDMIRPDAPSARPPQGDDSPEHLATS